MLRYKILFVFFIVYSGTLASAQVKIRIFTTQAPESAVFSVIQGKYEILLPDSQIITIVKDEPVIIARYQGKLAVKKRNEQSFVCDSLTFSGKTGDDSFYLRVNGKSQTKQNYSGDLECFPDFGTILLINDTNVEKYIAGVVMAEGGAGKNLEYFKTQAIIARTYMYKYFDKHIADKYNVCDDTHCQAFNGLSSDTLLNIAARETRGLVILDKDSSLIIAAFSSNCGGETSSGQDVWLSNQPYLKSIVDPYCLGSRNASWQKSFSVNEWSNYIRRSGFENKSGDPLKFDFVQETRLPDYRIGSFLIPLRTIRSDLNLKSTFFSVRADGDSIVLRGRGYGHGVGLCQEGAMVMAAKGFRYSEIINFYYTGVFISDVKNAVVLH